MKLLKYLVLGIVFGITLAKSEIISWFRIFEMFHFHSFHMFGVIGSAVLLGIIIVKMINLTKLKSIEGEIITLPPKDMGILRYLLGGTIFGLGWALIGACPGPIFILLGYGYTSIFIVLLGALIGTFLYGVIRSKLPH